MVTDKLVAEIRGWHDEGVSTSTRYEEKNWFTTAILPKLVSNLNGRGGTLGGCGRIITEDVRHRNGAGKP